MGDILYISLKPQNHARATAFSLPPPPTPGMPTLLGPSKDFKLNYQKEYKGGENQRRGEGGGEGRDLPGNFLLKGGHGV